MPTIVSSSADAQLAAQIDIHVRETKIAPTKVLIVVVSPSANDDETVQAVISRALDEGQRIIPVLAAPTPLPSMIEHLEPVDFSAGYDFDALRTRLTESAMSMKRQTVRTANRRAAYVAVTVALLWFLIGLLLIGGGAIAFPEQEYDAVETEVVLTRNAILEQNIPHSTQEAAEFASTVQAAPTAQRPYLIATATAQASGQ
jgi:hypothetical protein